jgi:hypothetical protein
MVADMLRRQDGVIGTVTAADMARRLDTIMVPPSGEPVQAAARRAGDNAQGVTSMVAGMPTEPHRCGPGFTAIKNAYAPLDRFIAPDTPSLPTYSTRRSARRFGSVGMGIGASRVA